MVPKRKYSLFFIRKRCLITFWGPLDVKALTAEHAINAREVGRRIQIIAELFKVYCIRGILSGVRNATHLSLGMAGMLKILIVPREPNSTER